MIIALFGADGRAMGTHAALVLARAAASAGTAATLLRVVGAHESRLPPADTMPNALRVVELCDGSASFAGDLAKETASAPGRLVVLDLPSAWLAACPLDLGSCPRIVAVGSSALDCAIAASVLRRTATGPLPWLLACGVPSVPAFERTLHGTMSAAGLDAAVRVVGHALPLGRQDEPGSAGSGWASPQSARAALRVLEAIVPGVVAMPRRPAERIAPALADRGEADLRGMPERLRDLADALDAAEDGVCPSAEELAAAPLLEDWEFGMRSVAALVGRAMHHPDFPAGRRVRTSEVYLSDRLTWARTYSRLYRLGRPAGARSGLQ